ncbi:SAC3/GANP/Nin1/mts3/eIF-3 p25 family-domain-containing protein [Pholiota molesta]|nr:SAC3/GANP/Nin1/mts3/eIF-3 p25 family-domain-containing protein [Pholiota molesta]
MSSESWPPPLKEWVAKCLGQITDMNRSEVQAELKQVISEAFAAHTLWTTDWAGPPPVFNNLKRKSLEGPAITSKKAKKAANKNATASYTATDFSDQAALNRRAQRFQREHELERTKHIRGTGQMKSSFSNGARSGSPYPTNLDEPEGDPNVIDWDRYTIVGTCQDIFKDYLRLTSEPKPETIRPYAVQRIKNDFTVRVYEIHARIALESGDMVEYNQCQATLRTLYDLGIPGQVEEFTAYRILMLLHGRNRSELNLFVGQLTPRQKANEAVKHALEVQRAQAMGNYGLMVITKVTLEFLKRTLAFETLDDARIFLSDHQITTYINPNSPDSEKVLDCKPAIPEINRIFEEKYRKVMIKGAI